MRDDGTARRINKRVLAPPLGEGWDREENVTRPAHKSPRQSSDMSQHEPCLLVLLDCLQQLRGQA